MPEKLVRHLFQLPWIVNNTKDLICVGGTIFLLHDSKIDVKYTENALWDSSIHGWGIII